MTISGSSDSFELGDYLGMLRRRWRIVVALTCLGVLLAGGYYKHAHKVYTATASVYVSATAANSNQTLGRTGGSVNMDNEAQLVQSETVAALAAKQLHSALPPQTLVKEVSITVPPNTTVLNINCKTHPRAAAAACANEFASAYLSVRLSQATDTLSSAISALKSNATGLITHISQLKAQVAALPANSPKHTTTLIELDAANSQLNELQNQINQLTPELFSLDAPGNTLAGHVITPATPPTKASSPRALLLLPSGLFVGLLLGLVGAFIAERKDDRIHTTREIERFFDLPVLLSVRANAGRDVALAASRSQAGREFAELARYVATSLGDGNHVLLVAGTSAGKGGSVTAANLAVMLARTRSEAVLICAPGSVAPELLGVEDDRGFSDLLDGTASFSQVARKPAGVPRLQVITPGAETPAGLSGTQRDLIRRVVADMRLDARFVIIEASAVGDGADALILAEFADAAIVVMEMSRTKRSNAQDCLHRLDRLGTIVLGAAVILAPSRTGRQRGQPRAGKTAPPPVPEVPLQPRSATPADEGRGKLPRITGTQRRNGRNQEDRTPSKDPADRAAG